jgi:hypothetical protein
MYYLYTMFVKRKKNRSGSVTVVVVAKKDGQSCYLKTMGTSDNPVEIEDYYHQGKKWIANQLGSRDLFTEHARVKEEQETIEHLLSNVENILLNGTQLILNRVLNVLASTVLTMSY